MKTTVFPGTRTSPTGLALLACLALLAGPGPAAAAPSRLEAGLAAYEVERFTTCTQFLVDVLPWARRGGDWRDAQGRRFGDRPWAVARVDKPTVAWDLAPMLRSLAQPGGRVELFLRATAGNYATFHSREARSPADWPLLQIELGGGRRHLLKPVADIQLDCTTAYSRGKDPTLTVNGSNNVALSFRLPDDVTPAAIRQARLILSRVPEGGNVDIGVFVTARPEAPSAPPESGLAARYPGDAGIARDPDVIFASDFDEAGNWRSRWSRDSKGAMTTTGPNTGFGFVPLLGSALQGTIVRGDNYGTDLRLYLRDHGGEPEALYFRYYLRLGSDWNQTVSAGKLAGLAGTYNRAGWGGRRVNGSDGWSARGNYLRTFGKDHPLAGMTQIGSYVYHADMQGTYGDTWNWTGAAIENDRWYCIEQYLQLNRPDAADGQLRVWIDGRPVYQRSGLRFRKSDHLRIETLWINVYHGGTAVSPADQHFFIDNVVLARRYIGPLGGAQAPGPAR